MARIAGVDLPREKRVEIALTYIYGIGRAKAKEILAATGVNPDTRVKDLTEEEVAKLRDYIDKNVKVEGDLRREVALNIKRLIDIGCYRGIRHGEVCRFAGRERVPMHVPEKVRGRVLVQGRRTTRRRVKMAKKARRTAKRREKKNIERGKPISNRLSIIPL